MPRAGRDILSLPDRRCIGQDFRMVDKTLQRNAAAYRLAALDAEFIRGDSMRGVHLLLEYAKAEERLRSWGIHSTIVVFGSAQNGPAGQHATSRLAAWYDEARRFARIVSERGGALTPVDGVHRNVIATGGGPGIMEAANRGAHDVGAPSIGFNIELPHVQEPNAYSTPDLTFQFHFFAIRKLHLALRASALVVFPGGLGTFDELFEILTLKQTHKIGNLPVLCFDRKFWTQAFNFDVMIETGVMSASDLHLLSFVDDAEEAWARLVELGLLTQQP
jgi:uncharacterized protein (TIGR00730 family)